MQNAELQLQFVDGIARLFVRSYARLHVACRVSIGANSGPAKHAQARETVIGNADVLQACIKADLWASCS